VAAKSGGVLTAAVPVNEVLTSCDTKKREGER
jgi:hypothetical protein